MEDGDPDGDREAEAEIVGVGVGVGGAATGTGTIVSLLRPVDENAKATSSPTVARSMAAPVASRVSQREVDRKAVAAIAPAARRRKKVPVRRKPSGASCASVAAKTARATAKPDQHTAYRCSGGRVLRPGGTRSR